MGFEQLPWWCRVCMLDKQIVYARNLADALPELEAELQAILIAEHESARKEPQP